MTLPEAGNIPQRVLFNSAEFLVFFLIVFACYWASVGLGVRFLPVLLAAAAAYFYYHPAVLPVLTGVPWIDASLAALIAAALLVPLLAGWVKPRVWWLLLASYYFYMSWNAKLAAVVAGSSLVDYFIAMGMARSSEAGRRKALLVGSMVMNLGLLFYFKYVNFFLASLHEMLARFGYTRAMPVLDVMLPIGISFYTFEAISYTVDVYRGRAQVEKNPFHFLLFITFFPRMIAGPIIRATNFLPQLKRNMRFSWLRFDLGMQYVLMGLFKKMAIADRMAYLSDPIFAEPTKYDTGAVWVAMIAYSLQIYCDFSGYSDVAIGTAHMLGFKLPVNFNMPYMAKNITEFWRRWHISLSTWLRDYVFIQLGGSRGTLLKTAYTLLMTFALCGLWHGAKWTFVAWGVMQGVFSIAQRLFNDFNKSRPALKSLLETQAGVVARVAVTYFAVLCSWVVFRSQDFGMVWTVFGQMFHYHKGVMVRTPIGPLSLVFAVVLVLAAHLAVEGGLWKKMAARFGPMAWGFSYALVVVLIGILMPEEAKAFIYFQF